MTQHSIRDTRSGRTFEFSGDKIGHGSSEADRPRWSEVDIYRTDGGTYILVKIGRTVMPRETDRVTVIISKTADGVIEAAHTYDRDDVLVLTNVAAEALTQACSTDEALRAAYSTAAIK